MALSIRLDNDSQDLLQHVADLQHRTPDSVLREAIAQYAERETARERFKQEALASWQHYQATGKHLSGEEVRAWMRTWGTRDEKTIPECHG
ncbi:Ribbon-helix-helix protein, CopG family [Paraburkholderia sacchari]|uniref:CopG family ribbon-helix-helix protein n=1 Tax=Paraburkholderia sacchari TaxID=159450 RepID=UPI0039A6A64D